jgi:CubicO group peptidase (beta-lactamase class C family)
MRRITRRTMLAGTGAAFMANGTAPLIAAPFEWQNIAPADAGFAPDMDARLDKLIADKRAWELHGVVVARGRRIVLERYFEAEDQVWGKPLGRVAFGPDTLHDIRSVTKSIVALVYGVALAEKKVPPPSEPLFAQFPEYADLFAADERRKRLTIHHALTMTLGTDWSEDAPYDSPANNEIAMEMAPERYRYILERPIIRPAGKRFAYNGGATALLGRIIAKGTGQSLPGYARTKLFDPLGLGKTEWITSKDTWIALQMGGGDGEPAAASGLRMTPRDLARIGQLVLDNGAVDGRQIVPADWLAECLTQRVSVDELRRYGYQWYIGDMEWGTPAGVRLEHWAGCFGNGGQRLFVFPDVDLVIAITAGNYSKPEQWRPPIRVVREVVLPSLR